MRLAVVERHTDPKDTKKQSKRRVADILSDMRKAEMYLDRVARGEVLKVGESKADYEKPFCALRVVIPAYVSHET